MPSSSAPQRYPRLRNRGRLLISLGFVALSVAGACSRPHYVIAPAGDLPSQAPPASSPTRHVVLVSIDGLRPDAIENFAAPTLQRLTREGSYAKASTILPSSTLPSHTSMLTGQPPERHHVIWNSVLSAETDLVDAPTIFGVARAHGYRTAAFFSKPKFHPLQRPGTLDYSEAPGGWFGRWSSDRTVTDVERYLAKSRPNILFVHLADPDTAGHGSGWMSDAYARSVGTSDRAVSRLLAAANTAFGQGNFTFIVTADHGGHDKGHGTSDSRDVTIPWIAWGQAVTAGPLASTGVRTMDTAATVLWLLGIDEPQDWMGQPVITAFRHAQAAETAATR